ncbi:putative periplasmic serine peptidase DegS, partial [Bordetella hinzii L60]
TRATVDSYAPAVAHAAPSVVNIYTTKHVDVPLLPLPDDPALRQLFGQIPGLSRRESSNSLGSGVIVSPQGYVLTNFHVVEAADAIEVALADGRQAAAKVVGADTETDLAVLKLAGQLDPLPVASYAEGRNLRVGDVVLAIGNPYGVGQTTTQGIVSALGRNGLGINTYENFIQTDAAINPGNSGGALIDTQGNLVGINTAIYSETGGSLGIGFAIPIDAARRVMDEIIKTGKVRRGWLGIEPQDLTPELARAFRLDASASGVIIAGILRGGPADQAGLRVGDIVQALNGQPARNTVTLLGQIAAVTPGQSAVLRVLRAGKTLDIKVTMGTRPARPK